MTHHIGGHPHPCINVKKKVFYYLVHFCLISGLFWWHIAAAGALGSWYLNQWGNVSVIEGIPRIDH